MSAIRISAAISLVVALAAAPAHAQRDTVRVGAATLRSLALPTGVDSSDTYAVRNGERRLLVTYVEEVTRTPDGYLIVGRNVRPNGAVVSLDSVAVATGTLAPVWHADSTRGGRPRGRVARGPKRGPVVDSAGARTEIDSVVPAGVYDYSMAARVVNLLPLRVGYAVVLPSYDIHRGPQFTRVSVLAEEDVEVRGRRVPAWKVEMDYGRFKATRWIHRETRKDVRTAVETGGMQMEVEYR
jgi:hypothetical protein